MEYSSFLRVRGRGLGGITVNAEGYLTFLGVARSCVFWGRTSSIPLHAKIQIVVYVLAGSHISMTIHLPFLRDVVVVDVVGCVFFVDSLFLQSCICVQVRLHDVIYRKMSLV